MTRDKFDRANELLREIDNVTATIIHIGERGELRLKPITRLSGVSICFGDDKHELSEGQVACIRDALKSEKERLQNEFENL